MKSHFSLSLSLAPWNAAFVILIKHINNRETSFSAVLLIDNLLIALNCAGITQAAQRVRWQKTSLLFTKANRVWSEALPNLVLLPTKSVSICPSNDSIINTSKHGNQSSCVWIRLDYIVMLNSMGKSSVASSNRAEARGGAGHGESDDRWKKLNRRLQCVKKKKHGRFAFSNRGSIPFCGKNGILRDKEVCEGRRRRRPSAALNTHTHTLVSPQNLYDY